MAPFLVLNLAPCTPELENGETCERRNNVILVDGQKDTKMAKATVRISGINPAIYALRASADEAASYMVTRNGMITHSGEVGAQPQ